MADSLNDDLKCRVRTYNINAIIIINNLKPLITH